MLSERFEEGRDHDEGDGTDTTSASSSAITGGGGDDNCIINRAMQVITRYMCKFCGLQFQQRSEMDSHAILHEDEKPPLTCGVCGKMYSTRSKLQRHVRVHSGERPFPCSVCGKRFPRSDHVKQHMKVHLKVHGKNISATSLDKQKNYCRLCGVKFENKDLLQEHLLSHGFNKLFSCTYCGEVFDSSEQLKSHRTTHSLFDDPLPVLTIPHLNISKIKPVPSSRKRKSGKCRSSNSAGRKSTSKSRAGLAKFKISRRSGSKTWEAICPTMKTEQLTPEHITSATDESMPILEKMQSENHYVDKKPIDVEFEIENDIVEKDDCSNMQMSISACYSLAEGQDHSGIPEIEEIRASTLTDGNNMVVIPKNGECTDDLEETNSAHSFMPESEEDEVDVECHQDSMPVSEAASGSKCLIELLSQGRENRDKSLTSNIMSIKPTTVSSTISTPTTTSSVSATLQLQVHPQLVSTTSTNANAPSSATTTRPTISLLPNVLAFRTHPSLSTPLQLHSFPTQISSTPSYSMNNTYTSYNNSSLSRGMPGSSSADGFPQGRKMMRCHHCCIWFEDSALGLLHQSLHSADETDPFTCKKCLKRLGNRLEFTAHIVWHLDPMMEEPGIHLIS